MSSRKILPPMWTTRASEPRGEVSTHALPHGSFPLPQPHRDFPENIFGPRPTELLETPLCAVERPYYMSGPDDNVAQVLARLSAAVGPNGFEVTMGGDLSNFDMMDGDDEMEDEEDDELSE